MTVGRPGSPAASQKTQDALGRQNTEAVYTVGTLTYNRRSVVALFGWLLWGDFAFNIFESVFARFMPLYLRELNASNLLISITTGSVAGLVNILLMPNMSQWSDRFRSRLGRRIPFLTVATPLTVMALLGIGFSAEIGAWLHRHLAFGGIAWLSEPALVLSLISVFSILFHCSNMVLTNSFNWLLRDVVPQVFMARFLSWFRIVGTVSVTAFLWYVFPVMLSHRKAVFAGIGIFYLVTFLMMCWRVKEGKYPEPDPLPPQSNFVTRFGAFFRDCLSLPIYRNFTIAFGLLGLSGCGGTFLSLYAARTLKLDMTAMGHIYAYSALPAIVALVPMGWLCDRVGAVKVAIGGLALLAAGTALSFLLVSGQTSWFVYSFVMTVPWIAWSLGSSTFMMQLFPSKAFGQFASALNVVGCGVTIVGSLLAGRFMDWTGDQYGLAFLWMGFFYAAAVVPLLLVYRDWRKYGGPDSYVAPLPEHMR